MANVIKMRCLALCLMLFGCSACGDAMQHLRSEYAPQERVDGKLLKTVTLMPEEEHSPKLDIYKIRKGYAIKQNLDWQADSGRKGDVVMSRSKEYKWFAGLQWRFAL